jgi:hypothetical protein
LSNGKLSIDHRYRGRAKVLIRALSADEAGWLMQREEVRQRLGEDGALAFERETIRRAGICPDCGRPLVTFLDDPKKTEWPRILDGHYCDPKEEDDGKENHD